MLCIEVHKTGVQQQCATATSTRLKFLSGTSRFLTPFLLSPLCTATSPSPYRSVFLLLHVALHDPVVNGFLFSAARIRELAGRYRSSLFPREHQPALQQLGEGPGGLTTHE